MSFLSFGEKKTRVYENILKFRTLNTMIRTWVERDASGPCHGEDYLEINTYLSQRRQAIDIQPLMTTAEEICKQFPRVVACEVMNGSGNEGVLLYPRWP
jgi:hypothetical protein